MLHCHDTSARSLSAKLLERPRLLERIRELIADPMTSHLACFTVTSLEQQLALELDIPIYGCDPALEFLGSKSGGREVFREAGVPIPPGSENLCSMDDVARAIAELLDAHPETKRVAVKLNEGFSGKGNALFETQGAPRGSGLEEWVASQLPARLQFEARAETFEHFTTKFERMGGIVEAYVERAREGGEKRSPSVQMRVEPDGQLVEASTHDQVLGGPTGQVFLGCSFPAAPEYRRQISEHALRAGAVLRDRGVLGRFAIDFVSVETLEGWEHYAIEVNLRKGGTTHPYLMLQFLTNGSYDPESGLFRTVTGDPRYYFASDNVESECYRGLTPTDLIDIAVIRDLHWSGAAQEGVVFHLIGALSEFGKLGVVCVGGSPEKALEFYRLTVQALDEECGARI